MAKRFTDNEKWKDAWFMDLPVKYKLFWLYLLDECNHAGVWKVNFKVATFYIGEHLEYSEVKRILNSRITILNDEYWYINKFIKYQYKCEINELNPKNKAHLSVLKLLDEYQKFKPLTSPLIGVKDKDKDKEKDLEGSNKGEKINKSYTEIEFIERWRKARAHYLKQPYNVTKLESYDKVKFKEIVELYDNKQIDCALMGLFEQKGVVPHILLKPSHFLDMGNFQMYLTVGETKEQLYVAKEVKKAPQRI